MARLRSRKPPRADDQGLHLYLNCCNNIVCQIKTRRRIIRLVFLICVICNVSAYSIKSKTRQAISANARHIGTARNISLGKSAALSSSLSQEPSIRLPPDEKGDIEVACEPATITVNSSMGFRFAQLQWLVRLNNAGVTTPSVLLKNDINPQLA